MTLSINEQNERWLDRKWEEQELKKRMGAPAFNMEIQDDFYMRKVHELEDVGFLRIPPKLLDRTMFRLFFIRFARIESGTLERVEEGGYDLYTTAKFRGGNGWTR